MMPPYSHYAGVTKRAESYFISQIDGEKRNLFGALRKIAHCCHDHCKLPAPFCCGRRYQRLEHRGSDHLCMITRMRMGVIPPDGRATRYPSRHAANITLHSYTGCTGGSSCSSKTSSGGGGSRGRRPVRRAPPRYEVPTIRADTLWRSRLGGRHISFIKIDVRAPLSLREPASNPKGSSHMNPPTVLAPMNGSPYVVGASCSVP